MDKIFELTDNTNDEMYFTLGLFLTLEEAVRTLLGGFERDSNYSDNGYGEGAERFEIHERKIGMGGNGILVWEVERSENYSDENDEYYYETTLNQATKRIKEG